MALFLRFTAIPSQVGPGVRIRLAPAASPLRTRLSRSGQILFLVEGPRDAIGQVYPGNDICPLPWPRATGNCGLSSGGGLAGIAGRPMKHRGAWLLTARRQSERASPAAKYSLIAPAACQRHSM